MIHVVATIDLRSGTRDEFLEEFNAIVSTVEMEDGCIEYGASVDLKTPIARQAPIRGDTVVILEKWESLEALQAHLEAPHMLGYRERVKDFVENATLQILRPV